MPVSPVLQRSAVPLLFKSSPSCAACPVLLRAAVRGEGGHRRCCCSATVMPVVTDLEYDALIMGQPPQSHQILVVCVTLPCQPVSTCPEFDLDVLDQLYGRMNLHRTTPCTQVQMLFPCRIWLTLHLWWLFHLMTLIILLIYISVIWIHFAWWGMRCHQGCSAGA